MTPHLSVRARYHRTERSIKRAFTLLELLVTIALLAIVGGLVILQINLDEDGISSSINAYSMGQVRDALLAFRRDMGYFPGQGPLAADKLNLGDFSSEIGDVDPLLWANKPTNLWQLFIEPTASGSVDFWKYDPGSCRGWNGPYLNSNRLKLHGYDGFDHIYAIADNFSAGFKEMNTHLGGTAYWAVEPDEQKKYYPGSPYILVKDESSGDYYLISQGPDGEIDPIDETDPEEMDDIKLLLGR